MALPDIDWHMFRAGTVVGSKQDNKTYEITEFEFSEQVDIGLPRNVRQNIELELEIESTGTATPAWWIPDPYQSAPLGSSYLMLDGHAYMLHDYTYELPTMILKVALIRAASADVLALSPFERAVQSFRQSLTSSH